MKKVLIACQCATNKGDRAIAEYLIGQLRHYKDINIVLSTTVPSLWGGDLFKDIKVIGTGYRGFKLKTKNNIVGIIVRELEYLFYRYVCFVELILNLRLFICKRISKQFVSEVMSSDLVIITGGHHITSIRNKNALFSITYDIALVSRFATKYVFWSQTIGPLDFTSKKIKDFFGKILLEADSIYLRDQNSFNCIIDSYGMMTNLIKSYDSVFGYGQVVYDNWDKRERLIGVSIFNGLQKANRTNRYIVELLNYCIPKGYKIIFFRMENSNKELEDINRIVDQLSDKKRVEVYPFLTNTDEHLNKLSQCRFFIGYKTHSVIMSLTTATPLLGICYHIKTRDFMRDFGMEDYSIIDTEIQSGDLIGMFKKLINNAEAIHKEEMDVSLRISAEIKDDFHQMLKRTIQLVN